MRLNLAVSIDFVIKTAVDRGIKTIEFLGDLFHTHAVLRVEVVDFWQKSFERMVNEGLDVRVLVGNHDQPGSKEKEQEMNALNIFKSIDTLHIIDKPTLFTDGIAYIPYMSDHEAFLEATKNLYEQGGVELLIAHQTFTGAQYENGFFSEEGIDPELIPQKQIISGHIHKRQEIGKCFYPGTPKWDTMSDANQPKGIWIFDHTKSGTPVCKQFISTHEIVTPINTFNLKEGDEIPDSLVFSGRTYITLEGKSAWISKVKKKLLEIDGVRIKVKPTDRISNAEKKSTLTIEEYLDKEFQPIETVSKEEIKEHLRNL